jgi:ABC-2 type transport system ATP-binding protein
LRLPADQHVVQERHTDRQSTVVVRTSAPILDPSWTVSPMGLEDIVLAYLGRSVDRRGLEALR